MSAKQEIDTLYPPQSMDRRGFLAASVATGFAAAAGPVAAQTVIKTDTQGLEAGDTKIPVGSISIPGYFARPAGKRNAPVILVVQEIFGVHEHIKDVCRRFAKIGYFAVAPEMFHRQGDPSRYTEIPQLFAEIVSKVPDAQVMADLDATAVWAGSQGGDISKLGVTGFCWGGRITWLYSAHNPKLKAGVAWYGRVVGQTNDMNPAQPVDITDKMHAPVLGLYGGKDTGIPLTTVEEMELTLSTGSKAAQASKFIIYPEAPHAFHADYRPSYREADAKAAWAECVAWFAKHLA